MAKIYPVYQEADLVVFASPLYYWGFSGQLKCAIDRLFAVAELDPDCRNPIKSAALLMAAEDTYDNTFAPVLFYYQSVLRNLGWTDCGHVCAGGNLEAGAILQKPGQLAQARALAPPCERGNARAGQKGLRAGLPRKGAPLRRMPPAGTSL